MKAKGRTQTTWTVWQRIDATDEWTRVATTASRAKAELAALECQAANGTETTIERGETVPE